MRDRTSLLFAATFAVIGFTAPPPEGMAAETVQERPKVYSSPTAVFDAFRESRDKQDWQTMLSCLTPELRDDQVFEAFFGCSMQPSDPKTVAVLKKHRVGLQAIQTEYHRRYKEKHGIDIVKLLEERTAAAEKAEQSRKAQKDARPSGEAQGGAVPGSSEQLGPPLPPADEGLLRKTVCAAIRNKPAFCADVDSIIRNGERPAPLGKLEQLRVQGDKADGLAKTVIYHFASGPDNRLQKVGQEIDLRFRFSKLNGNWFIESKD